MTFYAIIIGGCVGFMALAYLLLAPCLTAEDFEVLTARSVR